MDKFARETMVRYAPDKWRGTILNYGQLNRESSKIDLPSICNPGRFFSRKHCSNILTTLDTYAALPREIEAIFAS